MYRIIFVSLAALLACANIEGPQGPVGPAGPQGEQGEQGEQGPEGAIGTDVFRLFTYWREDFSADISWSSSGSWLELGGRLIGQGGHISPRNDFNGPLYVTVETQWLDGVKNTEYGYGLSFYSDDDQGYGFTINPTGHFSLFRVDASGPRRLADWTYSSSINQEGNNTLSVFIEEGRIEASTNGTLVATVFDDTYTEGRVGLLVTGGQEVAFDNLTVGSISSLD